MGDGRAGDRDDGIRYGGVGKAVAHNRGSKRCVLSSPWQ